MYQIVFTSEFKRNLAESTHASGRCPEAAAASCAVDQAPARPASAAAAGAGVAHLAFALALRLLGAP